MTYKESIKQALLKTDSEETEYDAAIFPVLANEAQMYIAKYGTHICRQAEYVVTSPFCKVALPKDFYRVSPPGLVHKADRQTGAEYSILGDEIELCECGEFVLHYYALPTDLTLDDADLETYEYEVRGDAHIAIPSYIGYQLVKTDDVQLAQILKNEWDKYMMLFDDDKKAVQKKIKNVVRW